MIVCVIGFENSYMLLSEKYTNHWSVYCIFGATAFFAFAPFNIFPVFLILFAWLFTKISLDTSYSTKKAFLFILFFHITSLYWLVYPLTIDIRKHYILIPFAMTLIPAYFAILLSISVFIVRYVRGIFAKVFIFPSIFCIITYLYGHGSLGFPWILPAYIWNYHEIFMQTLSIYGIYGLSFVTMLLSSLLGATFVFFKIKDKKNSCLSIILSLLLISFLLIFGFIKLSSSTTEFTNNKARIIQCSFLQNEKITPDKKLRKYLSFSNNINHVDIVIWPEAAIPFLYNENMVNLHYIISQYLSNKSYLISGAVRKDITTNRIYNSAVVIDSNGKNIAKYDKRHLVPFGEYVPFRKILPFQSIANDIGDFDVGESNDFILINGIKVVIAICYEAIFPLSFFSQNSLKSTDLIINLTNDGWFGYTSEPFQHLQIVRARTVEMGIPMIRATNYGISAVFDSYGREIAKIDINKSGFVDFYVPKKSNEQTPYSKYGDKIFCIMILISMLFGCFLHKNIVEKNMC